MRTRLRRISFRTLLLPLQASHGVPRRQSAALLVFALLVTALAALVLRSQQFGPLTVQVHAASVEQPHLDDPDHACAGCHAAIYSSYQQTSMARGSGLASEALHTGSFLNTSSGVTYRVDQKDGIARVRSFRNSQDQPLDDTEQLAYFIGSGKHGRTYLFSRTAPAGDSKLWYEAPVNWYARRNGYAMTPAYDNALSAPLALPTDAGCLHCHTTAVQPPLPSAINAFQNQPFKQGGVGCSTCHGDAAEHLHTQGKAHMLRIDSLSPARRDGVCLQCHLEGDAMVQLSGKALSRFIPGEDLNDTAVYFVNASSPKSAQRASSQYEGLLRSACRRAVGDRLTCTTCHDPHSSPAPEQRVAFYREKCLQCHADSAQFHPAAHHPEQQDCATCHMPSRATSDISHEQNVDHDIEARPHTNHPASSLELRSLDAPGNSKRYTHAIDLVPVGDAQPGDRELGLAYAQFAARGDRESYTRAVTLLRKTESDGNADAVVHEQLAYLAQVTRDTSAARREYEAALKTDPTNATALSNLAVIEASNGETPSAIHHLQTVVSNNPGQTAAVLNLAMLQCRSGDAKQAKSLLQLAVRFNPDSPEARQFLVSGDYSSMHCAIH